MAVLKVATIGKAGGSRSRDVAVESGNFDIDRLRHQRACQGIDHARMHFESAYEIIRGQESSTVAMGVESATAFQGVRKRIACSIHGQRYSYAEFVLNCNYIRVCIDVQDMTLGAYPDVVKCAAGPYAHRNERAVRLVTGRDADVLPDDRRCLRYKVGYVVVVFASRS